MLLRFTHPTMHLRFHLLAATALALAACANPGSGYASRHPELTPAQRRIFQTARIPQGDDVAGLTREQVKIAMGGDPATFDKSNGDDVWIYVRKKAVARDGGSGDDVGREPNSSMNSTSSFTDAEGFGPRMDIDEKTSVFFHGDRATRAQVTEERP
jgi:hypothetical protein